MDLTTIIVNNGVGVACAVAVLWFAWWRETHTIPNLTNAFTSSQKMFTDGLTLLQDKFSERNTKMLETFTQLVREERQGYERWHVENREKLDNLLTEIRDNKHYMRDLANQLGLRRAVEEEQNKLKESRERAERSK